MAETIKVCIRYKGREELTPEDEKMWQVKGNEVIAPNIEGKSAAVDLKFTFDSILEGQTTQEEMYEYAGKYTVK